MIYVGKEVYSKPKIAPMETREESNKDAREPSSKSVESLKSEIKLLREVRSNKSYIYLTHQDPAE